MPASIHGVLPSSAPITGRAPAVFGKQPVSVPVVPAVNRIPLRFLETRDLFFSSHSIRASIDPFLNDAGQKTLYLMFSRTGSPLRHFGRAANAVIVLEKQGASLALNTAQYDADDTVISSLFMPGLETIYRMDKPASWLDRLLAMVFNRESGVETRIRLPKAQEGVVREQGEERQYRLQGGDKAIRAQLRDDVLAAISQLEDAGYQLAGQQAAAQPVAKNPFKMTLEPGTALQPA